MSRTIKNNPPYHYWRQFRTYTTKRDELHACLELIEAGYRPNNRFRKRANPCYHITSWEDVGFSTDRYFLPKINKTKEALDKVSSTKNILLHNLFFSLKKYGYNFEIRDDIYLLTGYCIYGFITDNYLFCDRILPRRIQHRKRVFKHYQKKLLEYPTNFQLRLPIPRNDFEINYIIESLKSLQEKKFYKITNNCDRDKYLNRKNNLKTFSF